MSMDMFGEIEQEVTTAYLDGMLQIVVTATLDKVQVKQFVAGCVRISGISRCELDTFAPHSDDNTAFVVCFKQGLKGDMYEAVRRAARAYGQQFIAQLQPTAQQASMF